MVSVARFVFGVSLSMLAGCSEVAEQNSEGEAARVEQRSQCGSSWNLQDVNCYDGSYGVSDMFVAAQARPVGYLDYRCSGTLISRDLFLSAGHCNFQIDDVVRFGYERSACDSLDINRGEEFRVVTVVEREVGWDFDYSIVRLANFPGDTWGWASVASWDPAVGDLMTMIGHPGGVPKAVATGPVVDFSSPLGVNWFRHAVDSIGGFSGAGVLSSSGFLVGIHTDSGCVTGNPVEGNSALRVSRLLDHSATLQALTRPVQTYPNGLDFGNPSLWRTIAGDFDSDGLSDYARLGATSAHVFLNNGDGTLTHATQDYPSGLDFGNPSSWQPIAGDFNRDGRTDYARLGALVACVFLSHGDGTFTHAIQDYPSGLDFGFGIGWEAITGDFNSDGSSDYVRLGATSVHVFLSNGDGTFTHAIQDYPSGLDFGNPSSWQSITGDFNGDGAMDYARLGATSSHLFLGNGDGTFTHAIQDHPSGLDFGFGIGWEAITGDFNSDGSSDYVRLGATSAHVFLSNGDGAFTHAIQDYPSGTDFGNPSSWWSVVGDFNGDGAMDYARLGASSAYLFLCNGNGTFSTAIQHYPSGWDFGFSPAWEAITGYLDGDDRMDYARLGATVAHLFIGK